MSVAPHLVQYQGSKRLLAPQILKYMPGRFRYFIEPFSGMAAMTLATAMQQRAEHYFVNDINAPLINLLTAAVDAPESLFREYKTVWEEQFTFASGPAGHYYDVRNKFNSGNTCPAYMLYLLARCVKGAVRYSLEGKFNQGMDKRRNGTKPDTIRRNCFQISQLLNKKTTFSSLDYRECSTIATPDDIIYMDPPYQGVSNTRDHRYVAGIEYNDFVLFLDELNRKKINYLISYDGSCGSIHYGKDLPSELECRKMMLVAGKSAQATLLGETQITSEALYISKGLQHLIDDNPADFFLY